MSSSRVRVEMTASPAYLTRGLEAFAQQFLAQVNNAGPPSSEHAVHLCLALGFQAAYQLKPGAIVFEWPQATKRIDLWIPSLELAVEIKFRRPIPSRRALPSTQLFGQLLADFNKVARTGARNRVVVFVSDPPGLASLRNRGLLPMHVGRTADITLEQVQRLAPTAATNALAAGKWTNLSAELIWEREIATWGMLTWRVGPPAKPAS